MGTYACRVAPRSGHRCTPEDDDRRATAKAAKTARWVMLFAGIHAVSLAAPAVALAQPAPATPPATTVEPAPPPPAAPPVTPGAATETAIAQPLVWVHVTGTKEG